ncbi:katanin p80 WD40-containing subunit B1 [Gorgonomyces haynaldii]|nr:katanin p80 WD40-containing subunit B1 [Gorgonomyces haynaldii]
MIQKITSLSCHSNSTNCIKIGQKSSRIMVSGGDDCKVNLWALGKPNCLLSLSGHNAPIDSVCLDWPEELVVAGSSTGSIKLWDLEQAKGIFIRTLLGHSKSVSALEFHPFGEFFASGSNDEVKLWDVRRKGCIQTYHGHHQPITHLKITPDGRWVCSGSKDGVKLWDMTLGKLVHSFEIQNVKSIAFNPSEFVVSLSGEETSVFDLSTFELISKTKESGQLVFNNDGSRLVVCGDRKAHVFELTRVFPVGTHGIQEYHRSSVWRHQRLGIFARI